MKPANINKGNALALLPIPRWPEFPREWALEAMFTNTMYFDRIHVRCRALDGPVFGTFVLTENWCGQPDIISEEWRYHGKGPMSLEQMRGEHRARIMGWY